MPAINSRCRQWHKPSFLLLDSFRPVFRQVLKSCTFLFFMLSGLLKPHNHPSLIPLISENQPFPAYSLLSFRECSNLPLLPAYQDHITKIQNCDTQIYYNVKIFSVISVNLWAFLPRIRTTIYPTDVLVTPPSISLDSSSSLRTCSTQFSDFGLLQITRLAK